MHAVGRIHFPFYLCALRNETKGQAPTVLCKGPDQHTQEPFHYGKRKQLLACLSASPAA